MLRRVIEKVASTCISLVVFGWLAVPIHEGFHILAASAYGVGGRTELTWAGSGLFYPDRSAGAVGDFLIGLAGGLGVALVFLVLWALATHQLRYTSWELDDASSLALVALLHLAYSPLDALRIDSTWALGIALSVASLGWLSWYGPRLWRWLGQEE